MKSEELEQKIAILEERCKKLQRELDDEKEKTEKLLRKLHAYKLLSRP